MDLLVRRTAANAAKHYTLDTHGVGSTKNSTYIMLAADIIQYHHKGQFVCLLVFRHTQAVHLRSGQFFTHSTKGK